MKIKCGREEFDLNEKDVILDNRACFQIITRETGRGWTKYPPIIAKGIAKKLIKDGSLILKEEKENGNKYYKINKK